MPKSKQERIAGIEEQIQQLENQKKRLIQEQNEQERKARTRRLIERGAILESQIDGADVLTNDQIKIFLEKTIQTEFARRILTGLKGQNGYAAPAKPVPAEQGGNGAMPRNEDNTPRQAG